MKLACRGRWPQDNKIKDIFAGRQKQRGDVSLFLTILVLINLFVIGIGVAVLSLGGAKMSTDIGLSLQAFYAADAGIEKCLFQVLFSGTHPAGTCYELGSTISETFTSGNGASYTATITASTSEITTIDSIGAQNNINRKIELTIEK